MSTMETAMDILKNMSETQLQGFVAMFRGTISENNIAAGGDEQAKRDAAFDYIMSVRKSVPDFDDKAAYLEYLDERYGV